jgi:hypothetical protein
VTDKSKRPLKKRHASFHQHQPTNRVNKFLAQAIEARSMGQKKSNHVHALTLCFRDSLKEEQVNPSIPSSLFYYLLELFLWSSFSTNGMRTAVSAVPWLAVWAVSSWPFCLERSFFSSCF